MLTKLLVGLVLLIVVVIAMLVATITLNQVPLTDPPGLLSRLLTYLGSNVVQTSPRDRFPERRSMRLKIPAEEFAARALPLIEGLGWQPTESSGPVMSFVVSTPTLGFKDDVRLSLRSEGEGSDWLEVHAASRVGRGDLGANTRHLLRLREVLMAGALVDDDRP